MTEDDPRHGTTAGKSAHKRSGVPICAPCRIAQNVYKAKRKQAPKTPCLTCQKSTTATDRVCRSCRYRENQAAKAVSDDYELTGGQWVPRDGIMRWEPVA